MELEATKYNFVLCTFKKNILLIFLSILFLTTPSFLQSLVYSEPVKLNQENKLGDSVIDLTAAAQNLEVKYIRPVITGLKKNRASDKEFLKHLESIKPFIDTKIKRFPNAWAYDVKGKPFLQIDLVFLLDIFHIAELGATTLVYSNVNDKLFENIEIQYLSECVAAFKKGEGIPSFFVDLDRYKVDAIHKQAIETVTDEIMFNFVTFVILHELGHIYLGHTNKTSINDTESQKDELAADKWAFQAMNQMDYSLNLLSAALAASGMLEISRTAAGYGVGIATHPGWLERAQQLVQFMEDTLPPERKITHLKGTSVLFDDKTTISFTVELVLSHRVDAQGLGDGIINLISYGENGFNQMLQGIVEYKNGKALFYFRIGDRLCEIDVDNPKSHSPMAYLRLEELSEKSKGTFPLHFNHFGVGALSEQIVEWVRIGEAIEFDFLLFYDKELSSLGIDNTTKSKVMNLIIAGTELKHRLFLSYAKGKLDSKEINETWRIKNALKEIQIEGLLGNDAYNKLESAFNMSIAAQAKKILNLSQKLPETNEEKIGQEFFLFKNIKTGLIWMRIDNRENISWNEACAYCKDLTIGELTKWRLPTINELKALYAKKSKKKYKIKKPFELTSCSLWSATESGITHFAFHFNTGKEDPGYLPLDPSCEYRALCIHDVPVYKRSVLVSPIKRLLVRGKRYPLHGKYRGTRDVLENVDNIIHNCKE